MGQEVWSHGLYIALGGTGQTTDDFVALLGTPALRQRRQRDSGDMSSGHCVDESAAFVQDLMRKEGFHGLGHFFFLVILDLEEYFSAGRGRCGVGQS
jgi:hypothetical protein